MHIYIYNRSITKQTNHKYIVGLGSRQREVSALSPTNLLGNKDPDRKPKWDPHGLDVGKWAGLYPLGA